MRATLKSFVESLLLHGGPAGISKIRYRNRAVILAYHNVVPDGEHSRGDASLHLPLASFRAQLDALESDAEVVPLRDLVESPHEPASTHRGPRVAITFDDAYGGAVTLGLGEVAARGMCATMFVSPGRLGGESFWWDRYAGTGGPGEGDPSFRELALEELRGVDEQVVGWAGARDWSERALPAWMLTADEAELAEAARLPGIALGSHSWSHPNLVKLGDAELEDELTRPLAWLASRFESTIPWLAYPYGIADARVATAAAAAGYEAAARIDGGWLVPERDDRFMLPRLNIPAGLSVAGFRCRLAGLLSGR